MEPHVLRSIEETAPTFYRFIFLMFIKRYNEQRDTNIKPLQPCFKLTNAKMKDKSICPRSAGMAASCVRKSAICCWQIACCCSINLATVAAPVLHTK